MWISYIGLIGAGKTTELNKVENSEVILENVDKSWVQEGWITKYYSDIKNNAGYFQLRVLNDHLKTAKYIANHPEIDFYTERDFITCHDIFGKMLFESNEMDEMIFNLCQSYKELGDIKPNSYYFLNIDIDTAMERIKKRNREGENIPRDYQEKLNSYHYQFYNDNKDIVKLMYPENYKFQKKMNLKISN